MIKRGGLNLKLRNVLAGISWSLIEHFYVVFAFFYVSIGFLVIFFILDLLTTLIVVMYILGLYFIFSKRRE